MRTHGEVGDEGHHGNASGQVIEGAILARLQVCQKQEDRRGEAHDCADGKISAGTSVGEGNVSNVAIDIRAWMEGFVSMVQ